MAEARTAELSPAHVLALRLYTTSAFTRVNEPLRLNQPHPLPCTVGFLNEAIRRLRAVDATKGGGQGHEALDLWRGIKDCRATSDFESRGGSEYAPMSATSRLEVAVRYASSGAPLLLKIATSAFINRGADLAWLSCFAEEAEYLFPPLTYLEPTGRKEEIDVDGQSVCVVEVVPHL